ncbi:hypothetical protein RCC89_11860 [Cytophagaceae bacterium ABcell3]|nr:hypothetical protein RCC89_11860 [Cytophagaceae bacterium ABcell3]
MSFENDFQAIRIQEGILHVILKNVESIDLDFAKHMVHERKLFIKDNAFPVLIDCGVLGSMDRDARLYLADDESCKGLLACALFIHSPVQKIIGNFYVNINPPSIPSKVFTDHEEAIFWLSHFKVNNESNISLPFTPNNTSGNNPIKIFN